MEKSSQGKMSSPLISPRAIQKVLSNRSRTSIQDPGSENSSTRALRKSIDSTRDIIPSNGLSRNSSRDDSSKSGSSGIRKLIPGHAKRKRRRMREAAESDSTDNNPTNNTTTSSSSKAPAPSARTHSSTSLLQDDNSSLLTDEDEVESAS
jgi:hypothetical protein